MSAAVYVSFAQHSEKKRLHSNQGPTLYDHNKISHVLVSKIQFVYATNLITANQKWFKLANSKSKNGNNFLSRKYDAKPLNFKAKKDSVQVNQLIRRFSEFWQISPSYPKYWTLHCKNQAQPVTFSKSHFLRLNRYKHPQIQCGFLYKCKKCLHHGTLNTENSYSYTPWNLRFWSEIRCRRY